jgi:hypothetical protein
VTKNSRARLVFELVLGRRSEPPSGKESGLNKILSKSFDEWTLNKEFDFYSSIIAQKKEKIKFKYKIPATCRQAG